jgi:hydroxymethylpyrimidine/phosphomethylpyrimidine kinase
MAVGRILVIAGSDCSGGAYVSRPEDHADMGLRVGNRGLEADQKVIAAHKCYAMTATTALTIQNTLGVKDADLVPPAVVSELIKACLDDIGADVVKTGAWFWMEWARFEESFGTDSGG